MRLPFVGDWPMTVPFGEPDAGRGWWLDGYHTGIDYALPVGTSVLAMASGRIDRRGLMGGKGMVVQLDHGGGLVSRYCHLESFVESFGGVDEGQFIGNSGQSGFVTGPHLHWEVLRDGQYIDPLTLFNPPETPPQLVDGLWSIATVMEGLEHDPEANELRRIVGLLKPHLGL
jgi:murein DD-endopeptidase MepM/ murein hydrolase activator NlpD